MGIHLADQTLFFFQSMLVGAALGLFFDAFRISRIAIPTHSVVVFVEDLLFFLVCAVVTFGLMMKTIDGQVRFFLILGEGLGALLYSLTAGQLVMAVSRAIIRFIGSVLLFVYRWIIHPIWRLFYHIVAFLLRPFYFFGGMIKKSMQRCKFRLKVRRIVLYNHYVDLFKKYKNTEVSADEEAKEETL